MLRRWLRAGATGCLVALAGCATAPPAAPPDAPPVLFADDRFRPPAEAVGTDPLFALDDAMRRFIAVELAPSLRQEGRLRGLVNALYRRDLLQLRYDASTTRGAIDTFHARQGNCLSLVIMTAAFAKALDLPVDYRSALVDETWSQRGGLYLGSAHVNITVGQRLLERDLRSSLTALTIDFLPPDELRGLRTRPISEAVLRAMYANNRAAEALAAARLDDAYAWAREALRRAPGFAPAYNTLGVLYQRHGDAALAQAALRQALALDPAHRSAMANLAGALAADGQAAEAAAWRQRLAALEADPPFHDYRQGWDALARGDARAARAAFLREQRRSGESPELHHALALVHQRLGEVDEAQRELRLAVDASPSPGERARYAAKLDALRAASALQ